MTSISLDWNFFLNYFIFVALENNNKETKKGVCLTLIWVVLDPKKFYAFVSVEMWPFDKALILTNLGLCTKIFLGLWFRVAKDFKFEKGKGFTNVLEC